MINLKELILSFCDTFTVSGTESSVDESVFPNEYFDHTETDDMGNRYFYKYSCNKNAPLIMIDAHFDEVGFLISEILENGFLKVLPVGNPDMRAVAAAPLTVYGKEKIFAVAGSTPPHLKAADAGNTVIDVNDLLIDTGLSTERAKEILRVGDRVAFQKRSGELLGDRFYACGLDNKSTAAIALCAAASLNKENMPYNICVVLSSKEEGGCVGARFAARKLSPAAAIVLDVGFASSPDINSTRCIKMGEGTGISYSAALDRPLTDNIISIANEKEIPIQVIVENPATGTNADYIQFTAGVRSVLLSLPLFNMHTPVEVISMSDAEKMTELIVSLITSKKLLGGVDNE